jgi:methylglutaconyl-CoA hydratase
MKTAPEYELISVEINGPVCNIRLDREQKYNAMNQQMIQEIIEALSWSAKHSVSQQGELFDENNSENLRIIVLSAAGKHFCAGADINMMRDAGSKTAEENREDSRRLDALFNGLWSHPCFTIGTVQGVALGGGAGLIACLDHVITTDNVKIALSEGKLGILPAVIGPYVYRRVGSACFRRLSMQASRIDSEEALRIGMIEQVVSSADEFDDKVQSLIKEVLSTGPMAVSLAKELTLGFDRWQENDEQLRNWTLDFTSKMRGGAEGQEGLSSFLDTRKPNWHPDSK